MIFQRIQVIARLGEGQTRFAYRVSAIELAQPCIPPIGGQDLQPVRPFGKSPLPRSYS